jgi:hypothetical protein
MQGDEPFEELQRVLDTRVRSETLTAECLDDDTIAALAEGALAPESRAAALSHVASCARCRAAVASVARALVDRAVTREFPAGGRRGLYRITLPLAAAAVLLLLLRSPVVDLLPVHRGPPPPPATVPIPRSPLGAVAAADELRWSAVAGADRYRVTLFDAAGRVLYETQASDTVVTLPDSITLLPGATYLWKADARTGFDRWTASQLVEFTIAGTLPR